MRDNQQNKWQWKYQRLFAVSLLVLAFISIGQSARASATVTAQAEADDADAAWAKCKEQAECLTEDLTPCITTLQKCVEAASKANAKLQNNSQWKEYVKRVADTAAKEAKQEALATAFKTSLKTFSRQIAHDTAVWVASGGRGQKPLFITEGWGEYLKDAADSALGDFISKVGTVYGVNLCQPSLKIRLAITSALDTRIAKSSNCSISKIVDNWSSAISNPDFAFDYRTSMGVGENDITYMMSLADSRDLTVSASVNAKAKEGETNDLWKDIKNVAGAILTPGTFIKEKFFSSWSDDSATIGYSTFTGTVADVIEEFLNTLVSQLLKQLQSGFFSGSGGGTGTSNSLGSLDLSSLFNSDSSPALGEGAESAQLRYANLITEQTKVGSKVNILVQLAKCSDEAKSNPGPTDCVIDTLLQTAIKNKTYVIDLPDAVKSRIFAPHINQTVSLDSAISARSIAILRKYSIVPVGWEFAAQIVAKMDKDVTLQQVMDCYYYDADTNTPSDCVNPELKGLIDPYWVLKAPEEYCRKLGYSGRNTLKSEQSGDVSRNQDCVDEQQCLEEDSQGNCSTYGYCTEQRRTWDIGTTCSTKYNTCSNFVSRLGDNNNWLTNTLDFASCSSQNAGCRSYATDYNYSSLSWNGEFLSGSTLKKYTISGGEDIAIDASSAWYVPIGHSVSNNGRLKISSPCSVDLCGAGLDAAGCRLDSSADPKYCIFYRTSGTKTACTVPAGDFSCLVDNCFDLESNLLAGKNGAITSYESSDASNAAAWTDELSVLDAYDKHYRSVASSDQHGSSNSLKLIASGNDSQLITTLPNIPVDSSGKYYLLKFYAKGTISKGAVRVAVYNGNASLYSSFWPSAISGDTLFTSNVSGWKEYSLYFSSADVATATIAIITEAASITDFNLTDFRLYQMSDTCKSTNIRLFTAETTISASSASRSKANIYFNRNVGTCTFANNGCTQFIRIKQGLGSNLLANGSFDYLTDGAPTEWELSGDEARISAANEPVRTGVYSLALTNALASLPSANIPADLQSGKKYALSGYVYSTQANANVTAQILNAGGNLVASGSGSDVAVLSGETGSWKRFQVVFAMSSDVSEYYIRLINANTYAVYFDDIMLEQLNYDDTEASAYTSYDPSLRAASQVSYLKKANEAFSCYLTSSGVWPKTAAEAIAVMANRSSACAAYAPVCAAEEVGCELYTPTNGDPAVPGIATDLDLCLGECVGYQIYKQEATNFATSTYQQFIADDNAKYCSAAYVGCDEFTNLDSVGKGGEELEYYTQIKACQKPAVDDASYYTWEGSDTVGYQLKAYNLKRAEVKDSNNGDQGFAPCTNLTYNQEGYEGQAKCQDALEISGLCAKSDMLSNDDCREFYDATGNIHYRLYSLTVTVSDNCHPYRRTQTATTLTAAHSDCNMSHGYWNSNSECIYMAIPNEGGVCSAGAKGCREYTGNTGNNIKYIIEALNFSTTLNNISWTDGNGAKDGLFISSESTFTGGSSLTNKVGQNNVLKYPVVIKKNKAYSLSFWAKGNRAFTVDGIAFKDAPAADYFTHSNLANNQIEQAPITITTDWQKYDLGPVFVTWDPGDSSEFIITLGSGDQIYLDNLVLKELNDSVYLLENSWVTPVACDNVLNDPTGAKSMAADTCENEQSGRCSPGEMLGCSSYTDRSGKAWYLKSFTSLCREQAAGCEALIDTGNSNSPYEAVYNNGVDSDISKVTVPKDKLVYLVNDSTYSCAASAKGCQATGLPTVDKWDQITGYTVNYLINDPETYGTSLCKHSELWCEEYTKDSSGLVYFKNPGSKLCEYNSSDHKWYKSGTTEACNSSVDMTFGTGYEPQLSKTQPQGPYDNAKSAIAKSGNYEGFAGVCPAAQTSCSEYVDPYADIYDNLIPNKYNGKSSAMLLVKANTLYSVAGLTLATPATSLNVNGCGVSGLGIGSGLYYLSHSTAEKCYIILTPASGSTLDTTKSTPDKLAYAGVYYAKSSTVDSSSCNGTVNYKTGCILMNSRVNMDYSTSTLAGRYQKSLVYDSAATYAANLNNQLTPKSVSPVVVDKTTNASAADSNTIIKASPNRTCSKWLSCTTYQKTSDSSSNARFENTDKCLNIAVCSARDDNGSCIQYETTTAEVLTAANMKSGTSGYVVPNALPLDQMEQWGSSANVPNGNFETVLTDTVEPVGWNITASSSALNNDGWKSYKYGVGTESQYQKFDSGYLQISGVYGVDSDPIDVEANQQYILNFWANTLQLSPETAQATVFVTAGKNANINNSNFFASTATNVKTVIIDGQTWKTCDELQIGAGLGWVERSVILNIKATDDLTIKLLNLNDTLSSGTNNLDAAGNNSAAANYYPNYYNCYDLVSGQRGSPDYSTSCNVGGSSSNGSAFFDNFSMRPVLRTSGTSVLPKSGEVLSRSCRAYPSSDSKSCQYYDNNKLYYGWYGYCLLEDPQNAGQCLQWYPIDELKGDVVDEYSAGYSDRQPLYYCVEAKKSTTTAVVNNFDTMISTDLLSKVTNNSTVQSVVKSIVGDSINVVPFTFSNPATAGFMRYPFIQRFSVRALSLVVGAVVDIGSVGGGIMYYSGTMEKSRTCFSLGNPGGQCDVYQSTQSSSGTASDTLLGLVNTILSSGLSAIDIDLSKLSGNTNISKNSEWGGWGDVLAITQSFAFGVPISSWDLVEKRLNDGGENIASGLSSLGMNMGLTFNGSTMGAKIVTDTDSKYASSFNDTDSSVSGNLLGIVWGVSSGSLGAAGSTIYVEGSMPNYYCTRVVEVVTSMGQNKAWTNRVSQGSQFSFLDSDRPNTPELQMPPCFGTGSNVSFFTNPFCLAYVSTTGDGLYDDIDPTALGYQFYGYGADYKPYGAIVSPEANSQNPSLWDSFIDPDGLNLTFQPLYWDTPNLKSTAPYQPRMGQPVTQTALKQLFAKAYRSWSWVSESDADKTADYEGYYKKDIASNAATWDVPDTDCAPDYINGTTGNYVKNGYVRDVTDREHFCRIPPAITSMTINSSTAGTVNLNPVTPMKLDFTVRVDKDQLPLTSYGVQWGDGDRNGTSIAGVKLRAKSTSTNPFTLYHLYDYAELRSIAGTSCVTSFNNASCPFVWCNDAAGQCHVRIKITATDNWRSAGVATSTIDVIVSQD